MLDIERHGELLAYLRGAGILAAEEDPPMRTLGGGVSNRAVLVASASRGAFVVKQALAKLRVAAEWYAAPERIHREARAMEALGRLAPVGAIPRLLFEDRARHLIGMTAVEEPHRNWKEMLLAGEADPDHVRQFGELLGAIHAGSGADPALPAAGFADRSFFESLRLEPYYRYSARQVPEAAAFFAPLIEETMATRLALVHGDYSPKNILIHAGRLVLLDHEVAHWGDPAFDVGFSLTHLLSKALHLAAHRAEMLQAARIYASCYLAGIAPCRWRAALEPRAVRHTLGCLLARVAGRSPLEYLAPGERRAQQEIALALMARPPADLGTLIGAFAKELSCR
ncbi:MAG: phosphotransferase [Acidobacteriota bacterium]|nr:phosphotransferase [Acidobacteriota bacterium]